MPPVTSVTIVFDNNVTKVEIYTDSNKTRLVTTITTSGSSVTIAPTLTYYSTVYMADGYIIDKVVSNYGTSVPYGDIVTNITNDTFEFIEHLTGDTITITSKKATSQVSIDLTTLSGWCNVANGQHSIQIVAKADNYRDSEKSTAVSFTKTPPLVTIPTLAKSYDNAKEDIIDQYNGNDVRVVNIDTNEVIYEGKSEELKQNYTLIDVKYENGVVIMFVKV